MTREFASYDAPSPEEQAAIAADDALLDALGGRQRLTADQQLDPAARMLGAWVAELDAPSGRTEPVGSAAPVALAPTRGAGRPLGRRTQRQALIGAVMVAALVPAGMAAAVGQSPLAPYRAAVSAVVGTDAPGPAETLADGAAAAREALASGDTAAALAALEALTNDPAILADPALVQALERLEAELVDAGLPDPADPADPSDPGNGGGSGSGPDRVTGPKDGSPSENAGTGVGSGSGQGKGQGTENGKAGSGGTDGSGSSPGQSSSSNGNSNGNGVGQQSSGNAGTGSQGTGNQSPVDNPGAGAPGQNGTGGKVPPGQAPRTTPPGNSGKNR